MSANEDKLAAMLDLLGRLNSSQIVYQREYRFHPTRRWRADFAVWMGEEKPERPLLVEIEGAKYGAPGRHQRIDGIHEDCIKYAEAMLLGYQVLRVSARMVKNGTAANYIQWILERKS